MRAFSPRHCFEGNNRKQTLFPYNNRITMFHRITAAFSSWVHCFLTNTKAVSPWFLENCWTFPSDFNFTFPAYISFCLNRFGVQTWVNRRDYSILWAWFIVLHAEQTTLGSNPADKGVFQTLLASSLESNNLAVGAERHNSKDKGLDTVFLMIEHHFFTVFITNALENEKLTLTM